MSALLVVDASLIIKSILPNVEQSRCRELMADWAQRGLDLYAPTLCLYKTTSALTKAVHLGLLTEAEGRHALQLAQTLPLQLVPPGDNQVSLAYDWTRRLQRTAAYDSFYLALAESLAAEFWTANQRLVNAVNVPWVHYIIDRVDLNR